MMTRPMITVGIAFLSATFVASFFVGVWVVVCYAIILLFLIALLLKKKNCNFVFLAIAIALVCGVTSYWLKDRFEYQPILQLDNQTAILTGVITNQYQNEKGTPVYEVKVKNIAGHSLPQFKTKLYSYTPFETDNYDTVTVQVEFHKISSTTSFDAQAMNQTKELYVMGYIKGKLLSIQTPKVRPLNYYLQKLNDTLCTKVDQHLQNPTSGMIKAMLLGNQQDIDPMVQRVLSRAGIIHIISISGMHISFLAGFLFLLLKLFRIPNWINSTVGIVVVWLFVALVNFQVATVRSAIMVTVLLAGNLFGRPADHVNSLFLSGISIVLFNPFAIRNISFLLTFFATLGVLLCVKPMKSWIQGKWGIANQTILSIFQSIACTVGATIFILPIMAFTFGGISIISPIANLIAVPLTPIIMICGIIMLVTSTIPIFAPITELIADILALLNEIMIQSATFLQKWSYSYIGMNYRPIKMWLLFSLICLVMAILLCWMYKRAGKKEILYRCLGFSFFIMIGILLQCHLQENQQLKVVTIGSYETQTVVATYQGKATIISFESDGYSNQSVVAYLDSKNINQVESLILLEDNTRKSKDIAFLVHTKQVNTVMLNPSNQIIDYLRRSSPQKSKTMLLNRNYRVIADKWMRYEFLSMQENKAILLYMGNCKINITNSKQVAQKIPAEILYFSQKNMQTIVQFSSKYAILLYRYEKFENQTEKRWFDAFENRFELTVNQNGSYKLRK